MSTDNPNVVVQTPIGRVLFSHVFKARPGYKGKGEPNFAITLGFEKDQDLNALKNAMRAAGEAEWPKVMPDNLRTPLKDGDAQNAKREREGNKPYDSFKDLVIVEFKSKYPPGVVDANKASFENREGDFYAGCYARCIVEANAYTVDEKSGFNFYLKAAQKAADGTKLGGNSGDAFDEISSEDVAGLDVPDPLSGEGVADVQNSSGGSIFD